MTLPGSPTWKDPGRPLRSVTKQYSSHKYLSARGTKDNSAWQSHLLRPGASLTPHGTCGHIGTVDLRTATPQSPFPRHGLVWLISGGGVLLPNDGGRCLQLGAAADSAGLKTPPEWPLHLLQNLQAQLESVWSHKCQSPTSVGRGTGLQVGNLVTLDHDVSY